MRVLSQVAPASLKGAIRNLRDYVGMMHAQRAYRKRYGGGFIATIHPADDMFHYFYQPPKTTRSGAAISYLKSGESMLAALEKILDDVHRPLPGVRSFLEFASGYGRFTRFLVCRASPSAVTVSDLDGAAVAFARRTFSVAGFASTEKASDLSCGNVYEIVFVASLFSHLGLEHWAPWLRRLRDFLTPGGLLVFSTHGERPHQVLGRGSKMVAPGFFFEEANETRGRLRGEYYGTAYAFPAFVERLVSSQSLGRLAGVYPEGLYDWQDVYVIEAPG